jgi:hypothetical protein
MMKPEYDFSNAVRGKFYRPQGQLKLPVYLDDEVLAFFVKQAELQGVEVNDLLNERLRREMERLETN